MKIASLLSGGVDSSTSLYLLKEQGENPEAFYLKIWIEDDLWGCPWKEDLEYSEAVTKKLGIKLNVIPMQKEYYEKIIEYTLNAVKKGLTPNPDVFCNTFIKFGLFYEEYGKEFEKIATGHYAQIQEKKKQGSKQKYLIKAKDPEKDQVYFLSQLTKEQMTRCLFPIGHLLKKEVREIAKKANLKSFNRPDSQGLCFLGKVNFREFLKKYVGEKQGDIVDIATARKLRSHQGHWFYTVGQREGLKIGGMKEPYYVCGKNVEENIVYVSLGHKNPHLYKNEVELRDFNYLIDGKFKVGDQYTVQLRYHSLEVKAEILEINKNDLNLKLEKSYFGIAPGQVGVIYNGNMVMGSGVIR